MAFTADTRPTSVGNLHMVTGTGANGDTSADLSAHFIEVLFVSVAAIDGTAAPVVTSIATDGTTVHFADPAVAAGGKLIALGYRA